MLVNDIFKIVIILFIIPILLGNSLCAICKKDNSIASYYVFGTSILFAFMQFVGVPMVFLTMPFHFLYTTTIGFIIIFSVFGIVLRIIKKDFKFKRIRIIEAFLIIVTICVCTLFLYQSCKHQYNDADDSRFVVNAVDILETDRLFLTNPATGEEIEWFSLNDSYKDVIAPWATYLSLLSKFIGLNVATIAHSILPLSTISLMIVSWWLLVGKLFNKNIMYQSMFVIIVLLMIMYGNYTEVNYGSIVAQNVFVRVLSSPWQGKGVLAFAGIPMMFSSLFDYYEKSDLKNIFVVLIVDLAICFMSANGTVIGAIMIGSFALSYMITKKKTTVGLMLITPAVVNVMYYVISSVVKSIGG